MGVPHVARVKQSKPATATKSESSGTPVCIAALFCESVVVGDDKTLTIVRTIDTLTLPPGIQPKTDEPMEFTGAAKLVVLLKQASAKGQHEITLTVMNPLNKREPIGFIRQDFPTDAAPEVGYNFVAPVRILWRGEGLYWIEIRSGKQVIGKTPLRIKFAATTDKR
jgi:hypothetical protein